MGARTSAKAEMGRSFGVGADWGQGNALAPPPGDDCSLRCLLSATGLGALLKEPGATEIMVNRPYEAWSQNAGQTRRIELPNLSLGACMQLARVAAVYNRADLGPERPAATLALPDGERAQFVLPPACLPDRALICIRIPGAGRMGFDAFLPSMRDGPPSLGAERDEQSCPQPNGKGRLDRAEATRRLLRLAQAGDWERFFQAAMDEGLNIVLAGATGSGKTTLMKTLIDMIDPAERIVVIEDAREVDLPRHPNSARLFHGPPFSARDAVACAMRLRPDRLMLAELRANEAWDYLSALNTGHRGSVCTTHANGAQDALARVARLAKQSPAGLGTPWGQALDAAKAAIDVCCFLRDRRLEEVFYDPQGSSQARLRINA